MKEQDRETGAGYARRRTFARSLTALILKGLTAILPVGAALFLIVWIASTAERVLGGFLKTVLPPQAYYPGMGLVSGLVLIIILGLLFNIWLFQRVAAIIEGWLAHLPLVRTLLGGIKDLMAFLTKGQSVLGKGRVVHIEYANNIKIMGIMTRQNLHGTSVESIGGDYCAIYLPLSYQMGGLTIYAPYSKIKPIDISVEDAFRFAFTAGMSDEIRSGAQFASGGGSRTENSATE